MKRFRLPWGVSLALSVKLCKIRGIPRLVCPGRPDGDLPELKWTRWCIPMPPFVLMATPASPPALGSGVTASHGPAISRFKLAWVLEDSQRVNQWACGALPGRSEGPGSHWGLLGDLSRDHGSDCHHFLDSVWPRPAPTAALPSDPDVSLVQSSP